MAKKKSFEDAFLNIGNEVKNDITTEQAIKENKVNVELVNSIAEIQAETKDIINEQTLNQYVKQKVKQLENKISNETGSRFQPKKKITYSDKYVGITISIRPDLRNIIDDIDNRVSLPKCEIIELLLISGLKSINFDE